MLLMLFVSMLEVVGIASILPFIAVMATPEIIETNRWLRAGYDLFSFDNKNDFLFALGAMAFLILVISNVTKSMMRWITMRFSAVQAAEISGRLFAQYMYQPYQFFLQKNQSALAKNILAEVNALCTNLLIPALDSAARVFTTIFVLALLISVDALLALTTLGTLLCAYLVIYKIFQKYLENLGKERIKAQGERYKVVYEAFLGIKNIKLTGNEEAYISYFSHPAQQYARSNANSGIIKELPRYGLEIIAFGGLILIALYLLYTRNELGHALSIITLYAFSGYRLMPGLQAIYTTIGNINYYHGTVDFIHAELKQKSVIIPKLSEKKEIAPLPFNKGIELKKVSFRYSEDRDLVLENVCMHIPANSTIGFVGKTGVGKTTLIDIIMGLLAPTSGEIYIDGNPVTCANLREWQKNLSYVSQHIYLCDDTIRRNIAFGVSDVEINEERVRWAAKLSCIDQYIEKDLPEQYDTVIGDNGVRLSGGQRQRIGIARALYLDRPILVLDEATSALDEETERDLMQSIRDLDGRRTVLLISHRKKTLSYCSKIYKIENLQVKELDTTSMTDLADADY